MHALGSHEPMVHGGELRSRLAHAERLCHRGSVSPRRVRLLESRAAAESESTGVEQRRKVESRRQRVYVPGAPIGVCGIAHDGVHACRSAR